MQDNVAVVMKRVSLESLWIESDLQSRTCFPDSSACLKASTTHDLQPECKQPGNQIGDSGGCEPS